MKLYKAFLSVFIILVLFTGCEKMLESESDRLIYPESNQLNSPNDTLYSMLGIFTKLEKLAERYVLLGELRGDLMDVSVEANAYLQEINNFNISDENPYNNAGSYYSVINNCNYLIQNIDTSAIANGEKVMYKEFAQAKAIRAWTYLQIALNYGKVKYYSQPVLTVQDANKFQEFGLAELLPVLIQDLEPWKGIKMPGDISLGFNLTSNQLFFPLRLVLGDLYLWNQEYEKAVVEYYNVIFDNTYVINALRQSTWTVVGGVFVSRDPEDQDWSSNYEMGANEFITLLASPKEENEIHDLLNFSREEESIVPSEKAYNYWDQQLYYESATVSIYGDLRGESSSYFTPDNALTSFQQGNIISKFGYLTEASAWGVPVYRKALLYLRFAEALNRTGKPNAAWAVLKNGMNLQSLNNANIIPAKEKYKNINNGVFHDYLVFSGTEFNQSIGVHALGCGNVRLSTDYVIAQQVSHQDSVLYVENKILEELALETAFEGNRFHDIMRIAKRRNNPAFLADMVSEKHTANREVIWNKLIDENNWYLP